MRGLMDARRFPQHVQIDNDAWISFISTFCFNKISRTTGYVPLERYLTFRKIDSFQSRTHFLIFFRAMVKNGQTLVLCVQRGTPNYLVAKHGYSKATYKQDITRTTGSEKMPLAINTITVKYDRRAAQLYSSTVALLLFLFHIHHVPWGLRLVLQLRYNCVLRIPLSYVQSLGEVLQRSLGVGWSVIRLPLWLRHNPFAYGLVGRTPSYVGCDRETMYE